MSDMIIPVEEKTYGNLMGRIVTGMWRCVELKDIMLRHDKNVEIPGQSQN